MRGISVLTIFLCGALPCAGALAGEMDESMPAVNFFANCAGVWDFQSELEAQSGKPASAEMLRNLGNGAQMVALWTLANSHSLDTGEATQYGSWLDLVRPRRESANLRMKALAETEQFDVMISELKQCSEALEAQEGTLQLMRKDRVREAQAGTLP